MKLKLRRCQICHDWFSPLRSHCPCCGAGKIATGVYIAVSNNGKAMPIASGLNRYSFNAHAIEIARELAKSR